MDQDKYAGGGKYFVELKNVVYCTRNKYKLPAIWILK